MKSTAAKWPTRIAALILQKSFLYLLSMRMRYLFFLIIFLGACRPPPTSPNTLVVGLDLFPQQFDPRKATDAASSKINRLLHAGLLKADEHQAFVPDLAETFQMPDAVTYLFTLKPNLVFSDGTQLTSADVKATYQSLLTPATASPFKSGLDGVRTIETPDARQVIFHLKEPHAPFLTLLTLPILKAADAQTQNLTTPPIGAGAYVLNKIPDDKSQLLLIRNPNDHSTQALMPQVIFRVIQDGTLRAMELLKGRLDLVQNGVPYVLVNSLKEHTELNFESAPGVNFSYMAFNFNNPILQNLHVRQAIAMAIDREKLIQYKLAGLAQPASSLLSPTHWAVSKNLPTLAFDPEKAKKLLDQTPYKDPDGDGPLPRFTLVYKTSSVKERIEIAQLIAEGLGKIGIAVELKSFEFGTFYRDIRQGDFDLFTLTWVGVSDPDIYYLAFHSSQKPPSGANRGSFTDKTLDRLLETSRTTVNNQARQNISAQIQQRVFDAFAYVPLWYEANYVFSRKSVTGYELRPDAGYGGIGKAQKD
jgi:peptide/nickel transport system substrate-binding protein